MVSWASEQTRYSRSRAVSLDIISSGSFESSFEGGDSGGPSSVSSSVSSTYMSLRRMYPRRRNRAPISWLGRRRNQVWERSHAPISSSSSAEAGSDSLRRRVDWEGRVQKDRVQKACEADAG